ncbi:MAG TPA: iron-containing alcohol dehydrogenase [Thermoleophilaceae bacterium]
MAGGVKAREFLAGTRIVHGSGCVGECLPEELAALRVPVVALVADRGLADLGLLEALVPEAPGIELPLCGLIGADPDLAEAERAAESAIEHGAQAVLGIGGGSALCAAKAVAIRLRNPGPLDAYAGREQLPNPPAPVIAIPTTAGSGTEVSPVVVLHDSSQERHVVIRGRGYEPAVALLDGTLLRSLPRRPMIHAALDALSHCYESLWSRCATQLTDALALSAAATIRSSLVRALGGCEEDMQDLIEASAIANLACGNAQLGLVHALSSAPAVELPHGYQNGVLLPHVAEFNRPVLDERTERELEQLPGFYESIGFEARFAPDEIGAARADAMVAAAMSNPFRQTNRRPSSEADLRGLMAAAGAALEAPV